MDLKVSSTEVDLPCTVDETAAALRISRASAYRLIEEGAIKAIRLGRTLRVPRAEVRRLQAGG